MTETSDRERIAARIRGLRAKTVENGCTEGEAIAAAEKAAELLRLYNLTLDEVELRASPFERHRETHVDDVGARLWKPASAIAVLSGVTWWASGAGVYPVEISFFGLQHEVEVASYLLDLCAGAMRREQVRLAAETALFRPARARLIILPFLDGMADRLRQRILARRKPEPTGSGLVVLRAELLAAALRDEGIKLQAARMRSSRDHEAGYRDGQAAADRVALNAGLAAPRAAGAIQ